jgi:hypothetical protein
MASPPAKRRTLKPPLRIECARPAGRPNFYLGYGSNVSETGVFVQSLAPRPPGTRLRLVMYFAGSNTEPICSDAEVRWVRSYRGKRGPSAGMGMHFLGMRPSDRSLLQTLCSTPTMRTAAEILPQIRVDRRTSG